jgi:predicted nucleotidyltransferase
MNFETKRDFEKLRSKLLKKLYEALDGEPNAQMFKFTKEILDSADIEILEKKKEASKLLEIINNRKEKKNDNDTMEDIAQSK